MVDPTDIGAFALASGPRPPACVRRAGQSFFTSNYMPASRFLTRSPHIGIYVSCRADYDMLLGAFLR
ncbi:hypothetical protein B0H19DRAFT_1145883 [Mycena capillaripes]|nr:hypothetical protein B0H19DRAFT_1145883 [Mycena capillaripes]